jgi:hypothetical protein
MSRGFQLGALACLLAVGGTAAAGSRLMLLTTDEAARLRLGRDEMIASEPNLRGIAGPRIVVREPTVRQTREGGVIETAPCTQHPPEAMPTGGGRAWL